MGRRSKTSSRNKSDFDQLVQQLQPLGYHVRRMEADGNCLFRSFGDQMDGHPDNHQRFRDHCCQFMIENIEDFEPFYCHNSKDRQPRTFETYVKTMKLPGVWGSQLELMALCRRFNINAIVHQWGRQPYLMGNAPQTARCIQLTFHDGNHYNSVRIASDESVEEPVQHVTVQQLKGPALTEEDARKRDDVAQVQGAKKTDPSEAAPLNEEGFSSLQKSKNEDHMKHYIRRLICTLGLVMDEGVVDAVVSELSGFKTGHTFCQLKKELIAIAAQEVQPGPSPSARARNAAARRRAKRAAKKAASQGTLIDEHASMLGSALVSV